MILDEKSPSPAPIPASSASPASQASAANGEALPAFPSRAPIYHEPGDEGQMGGSCQSCHEYDVRRADAWEARARTAIGVLNRYAALDTERVSPAAARQALAAIGPLPSPKEPKEQRT